MTPMNTIAGLVPTNAAETPAAKKTPGDFQAQADAHNARVADNAAERARVQAAADALNAERETMVGDAVGFGVTAKYGRAALRKA